MDKYSYGGFEAQPEGADDEPWTKLATIREHLEAGEPLPPHLASWLGEAIIYADCDPDKLVRRLELKRGRGRPHRRHDPKAWLEYGKRCYFREGVDGQGQMVGPEAALAATMSEYLAETGTDVERSTMQEWRNTYAEGHEVGRRR